MHNDRETVPREGDRSLINNSELLRPQSPFSLLKGNIIKDVLGKRDICGEIHSEGKGK